MELLDGQTDKKTDLWFPWLCAPVTGFAVQSIVSSPLQPDGVPEASEPDCGASSEQEMISVRGERDVKHIATFRVTEAYLCTRWQVGRLAFTTASVTS